MSAAPFSSTNSAVSVPSWLNTNSLMTGVATGGSPPGVKVPMGKAVVALALVVSPSSALGPEKVQSARLKVAEAAVPDFR